MPETDVWMVEYPGGDAQIVSRMNPLEAAAAEIAATAFPGFEYVTGNELDADYILALFPREVLEQWCHFAGYREDTRPLTVAQLVMVYLRHIGRTGVTRVKITSYSPQTVSTVGGDEMHLRGFGFVVGHPGANAVTIDGEPCTITNVESDDSIFITAPAHIAATELTLTITNANGTSSMSGADGVIYEAP